MIRFCKELITDVNKIVGKTITKVSYLDTCDDEVLVLVFSDKSFAVIDEQLDLANEDYLDESYLDGSELFKAGLIDEEEEEYLGAMSIIDELELDDGDQERIYEALKRKFG